MRFGDRSLAVVTRGAVGYRRADTAASRFAEAYHATWPSVRLEPFGATARQVRAKAAATVTPAPQALPPAAEIHDTLLKAALAPDKAAVEVIPESVCAESVGDSAPARAEPDRFSADVSIGPSAEDTIADVPEQEDGTNEDNMADLADVDPPEFPEDDVEADEEEEDAFRLR